MWRRVFNTQGNTTLMALFVVGVVSSGVYFISNKIIVERKLTSQLRKDVHANLALRSITDYMKYGIRKGWCFDDKLLPEAPELCVNNYDNKRSTIRLMMPISYAKTLENLGSQYPADFPTLKGRIAEDLILESFTVKMDLATLSISQAHPLYRILSNLRSSLIKGLNIKVARISNVTLPVNGDEVYLEIVTEFLDKNGKTLRNGNEVYDSKGELTTQGSQFFRETARFISNPREVNAFVLMLPGTIYLGRSAPPELGRGDLAIPLGTKSDRGMVFNSPVFVNENIFLNKTGYTPATFNEGVVLGNGIIKTEDGAPFKINDSLGVKRYWADLGTFGGFVRGLDSDGKRDLGLSTLNGASDSTTLNNETITQCINIIRSQSDPDMTLNSRMVSEPVDNAALDDKLSEYTNRFSFSQLSTGAINVFVPQVIDKSHGGINLGTSNENELDKPFNRDNANASTVWYSFNPTYDLTSGTKLVMWTYMQWGSDKIKLPILENTAGDGHKVILNFSPYSKDDVEEAKTQTEAASSVVQIRLDKLADLETKKPDPVIYPVSYTIWLNTKDGKDYLDLSSTATNNKSVAYAQDRKDKVEAEYLQRQKYYEEPGQLEISSLKPTNGFAERQSVFRNVTVKIVNPKNFKQRNNTSTILYGGVNQTNLTSRVIEKFSLEGMDYSSVEGGISTRPRLPNGSITNDPNQNPLADINNVHYRFAIDSSDPDRPMYLSNRGRDYEDNLLNLATFRPLDVKINYQKMINKCFDSAGGTNLDAFKPASFASADFTKVSPDSWHFASPDPKTTYFSEDIVSSSFDFKIAATREKCTIHAAATTVTGFFVCRSLEILPRSTPLQMIGTFIVTKNMKVDPSALKAGVFWSSIHNQQAVGTMKQPNASGVPTLRRASGANCASLYSATVPFWHPDPGLDSLADRIRCSSTFVLQGKGPPRWTSVDPDCGRVGDSSNTQCLKRIRNFNLIQLERVYGL